MWFVYWFDDVVLGINWLMVVVCVVNVLVCFV